MRSAAASTGHFVRSAAGDAARLDALERLALEQASTIADLLQRVAALERSRGDDADGALLSEIARTTEGGRFTARSLWRLGEVDDGLGQALGQSCVGSVRELGHLLPRLPATAAVRLVVVGDSRDGRRYRCDFCD